MFVVISFWEYEAKAGPGENYGTRRQRKREKSYIRCQEKIATSNLEKSRAKLVSPLQWGIIELSLFQQCGGSYKPRFSQNSTLQEKRSLMSDVQVRNQDFMWGGGANGAKVDQTTEMYFLVSDPFI